MSFGNQNDNLKTNPYAALAHKYSVPAAEVAVSDRVAFLRKTYLHLAGAVSLFIMLELIIFNAFGDTINTKVLPLFFGNWISSLVIFGLFIGGSMLATSWANNAPTLGKQYLGLGLYVLVWTVVFIPVLAIASTYYPEAIITAAILTIATFGGLTVSVFITGADFSFLRSALVFASFAAFAFIIAGMFFNLPFFGLAFCGAMILLAAGYVLYDTSRVLHHYPTDRYVGAALALFSGLAMLFYYILSFVMQMQQD